jgi:hypothetical protein
LATNLPSFESEAAAVEWNSKACETNPLYEPNRIVKIGKCETCGKWHFVTKSRPPSGSSSGTSKR